jgi:hypothetical protein
LIRIDVIFATACAIKVPSRCHSDAILSFAIGHRQAFIGGLMTSPEYLNHDQCGQLLVDAAISASSNGGRTPAGAAQD